MELNKKTAELHKTGILASSHAFFCEQQGEKVWKKTKGMSKSFVYLRFLPRYHVRQDKMKD